MKRESTPPEVRIRRYNIFSADGEGRIRVYTPSLPSLSLEEADMMLALLNSHRSAGDVVYFKKRVGQRHPTN